MLLNKIRHQQAIQSNKFYRSNILFTSLLPSTGIFMDRNIYKLDTIDNDEKPNEIKKYY